GIFVIPFLGLPIGFLIGLYVSEALRLQDWSKAITTAWVAIKALGVGILIEFSLAMLSTITFAVAVVVHFVRARLSPTSAPSPPAPPIPAPVPPTAPAVGPSCP